MIKFFQHSELKAELLARLKAVDPSFVDVFWNEDYLDKIDALEGVERENAIIETVHRMIKMIYTDCAESFDKHKIQKVKMNRLTSPGMENVSKHA